MSELKEVEGARSGAQLAALTAAWRDVLVEACGIDGAFQLAMGAAGLAVADSSGLMRYADIAPPRGPAAWVDEYGSQTRSQGYLHLLHALLPAAETGLRGLLGPHYCRWIACRNADPRGGQHMPLFHVWATNNLPHDRAETAIRLYKEEMDDPLLLALDRFFDSASNIPFIGRNGRIRRLPLYSATYDSAVESLRNASSANIAFDSMDAGAGALERLSGEIRRGRYFWSRSQRQHPELRELDARALSSRITIAGRIDRVSSIVARPGDWMDGFELERAWTAGDDPGVWDEAAGGGGWNEFFGPDGSLARRVERIVVAGGYDLVVTSHARYSPAEAALVRAEATGGVWPMIAGDAAPTHKVRVRHNADGSLSHQLSLAPERVQILGGLLAEAPA